MTEKVTMPSEAETKEAIAEAGPGANNAPHPSITNEKSTYQNGTATNGHANGSTASDANISNDKDVSTTSPSSASPPADAPPTAGGESVKPLDERPKSKVALIMFALCMAVFLAALDLTIVATALPTIAEAFHISQASYTWIGSAYSLTSSASTPAWGKISDIFGRKPVLLVANVVFFVGSLICGLSVNIEMLLAGRAIQGIGGGGLLCLVNICIGDLFSQRSRGLYYGMVGMVWAFAGAIGPVLGGVLSQYSTWRWCFYINLPCDGVAFVILFFFLDIETPRTPLRQGLKAIDWLGLLLIVGGVVMFLLGLGFGGVTYPWASATVICTLLFGVITLAIFLLVEWKVSKFPMMPLRLFNNRSALACFATVFCHGMIYISGSYFLPLYFQSVLSATPTLAGVYQFPFILCLSLTSIIVGLFIRKTGLFAPPIVLGMATMTLGFGLFINLPDHSFWPKIAIYQVIAGLGTGPNFQAPLIALQSHTRPADLATATATFAFVRQLGAALSIVIGGVIFQARMSAHAPILAPVLTPQTLQALTGGSAGASVELVKSLGQPAKGITQTAFTESLSNMWTFYAVLGVVGTGFSLLIKQKTLSKVHEVRKQGLDVEEENRLERIEEKRRSKQLGKEGETA